VFLGNEQRIMFSLDEGFPSPNFGILSVEKSMGFSPVEKCYGRFPLEAGRRSKLKNAKITSRYAKMTKVDKNEK
jgi:hypothetical protein